MLSLICLVPFMVSTVWAAATASGSAGTGAATASGSAGTGAAAAPEAPCELATTGAGSADERSGAFCPAHQGGFDQATDPDGKQKIADIERQATTFWTTQPNTGYVPGKINDVKVVFSFASKDKSDDATRPGFKRVMELIAGLNQELPAGSRRSFFFGGRTNQNARFYVDAKALATLPGAWWYPREGGSTKDNPGDYTNSLYWQQYYQEAMASAEHMVFLLTEGWFASKNCIEELEWAIKDKAAETPYGRKGLSNLFVLLDQIAKQKFAAPRADPTNLAAKEAFDELSGGPDKSSERSIDIPENTGVAAVLNAIVQKLDLGSLLESSANATHTVLKKKLRSRRRTKRGNSNNVRVVQPHNNE